MRAIAAEGPLDASTISDVLAIGALGSCRVHNPLTRLAAAGKIKFKTDSVIGYLHNPLEIIQAVQLLKGATKAPLELAELINIGAPERLGFEDRFAKLFTNVDVLVVEISSIRVVEFRDWHLQINRVREFLQQLGLQERDLGVLFQSGCNRRDVLSNLKASPSELASDLILNASFYELEENQLVDALESLLKLVKIPMAVTGVVAKRFDGSEIAQRAKIRTALAKFAGSYTDVKFIDPMPIVEQNGIDASMLDLGHYRAEFEPVIATLMLHDLTRFSMDSAEVRRLMQRRRLRDERRKGAELEHARSVGIPESGGQGASL